MANDAAVVSRYTSFYDSNKDHMFHVTENPQIKDNNTKVKTPQANIKHPSAGPNSTREQVLMNVSEGS